MKFKAFLLVFVCALLLIGDVSARVYGTRWGSGRSWSRIPQRKPTYSGSRGTSHGGSSQGSTRSGSSPRSGTSVVTHPVSSPPKGRPSGDLIRAEGGGATRPGTAKTLPPFPTISHPGVPSAVPTTGGKPGVTSERKQTSPYYPSAPNDPMMKATTGTLQSQAGQANPAWSNPHLPSSHPSGPGSHTNVPGSHPSVPGPYPNTSPTHQSVPGSPPPIGFKPDVYTPTRVTSPGTQFSSPKIGQPPYPISPMPQPSTFGGPNHVPPPHYQTHSLPLGNPYSMHPPGGTYSSPGVPTYGPVPYPQQTQVFGQPAMQPVIPGQTILMVPGQQQSGPGVGQLIKEALIFSTINAGVNRIIDPPTHHNYVESRPAESAAPPPTTHITYNTQYYNSLPGVNGTANPGVPQAVGPSTHTSEPTPNVPTPNYPSGGSAAPNVGGSAAPNVGGSAAPNVGGSAAPNVGGSGVPTSGYVPHYVPSSSNSSGTWNTGSGNVTNSGMGTSTAPGNNQTNDPSYSNTVDNTPYYRISDEELYKISEELFTKGSQNISNSIRLNLQARATGANVTDEARYPLFNVEPQLLEYPSIYAVRSLYDSYVVDFRKKINRTIEIRKKENLLIDTFLNTNEMSMAMQWLADRGFVDPDDFERKDVLRRLWFTIFSGSSSGFERVFASENYGTAFVGVQDWLYFHDQESQGRINYMSYTDKLSLGSTASLLKLNFQMDGLVRPNATIFVGTLPELEMALYTVCFYTRPNDICPVSLGGTKFTIYTHSFTYFGVDVIDLAFPVF